ncbi:MAG: hypothetical protein ACI3UZ_00965 [Oscillospiraceae bacterium]|nr:hypothetical protein [Oscillospiraceae bacterium]
MKKAIILTLIMALSATLLCGCQFSFNLSFSPSPFCYDNMERYTVGGAALRIR